MNASEALQPGRMSHGLRLKTMEFEADRQCLHRYELDRSRGIGNRMPPSLTTSLEPMGYDRNRGQALKISF